MTNVDMFDYLLTVKQPDLPPPPKPAPKPAVKPSEAQARATQDKSLADLRAWWAELPEKEKQEVRNKQFPDKKKDKKKKEADKAKAPEPAKPKEGYSPLEYCDADNCRVAKPDIHSYAGPQQWAIAEI
jgi:hypothetical protein